MEYDVFKKQLLEQLAKKQEWGISRDQILFYPDGLTAEDDPETLEFIRSTNIRYHKCESDVLMGDYLVIEEEEKEASGTSICRFSLQYLYECFQKSGWELVWENVRGNLDFVRKMNCDNIMNRLADYEAVRERLILRPINYTDNRHVLKGSIYDTIGDIALVLYLVVKEQSEFGLMTAKIPENAFWAWGVEREQVWENALLNTNIMAPPRIYLTVGECFNPPYERGAFMSVGSKVDRIGFHQVPTLTTTKQTNGAIALFYPGVQERLAQMAGGSYYIAFTSIHEARLHCDGSMPPKTILGVIQDVNREFDPAEILTRKVFYYDAEKRTFGPVEL